MFLHNAYTDEVAPSPKKLFLYELLGSIMKCIEYDVTCISYKVTCQLSSLTKFDLYKLRFLSKFFSYKYLFPVMLLIAVVETSNENQMSVNFSSIFCQQPDLYPEGVATVAKTNAR